MGRNEDYIYGWLYDLTDKRAKKWLRGTTLRLSGTSLDREEKIWLIMESRKAQQYGNDFKERQDYFSGYAVELWADAKLGVNFTHAKTFVGEQRRVIQTANLTHSSLATNVEHFFFGTDPKIKDDLLALWQLDQSTILSNSKSKKGYTDWLRSASPNLLVCPLNCRQKIEFLITHAKQSIWISQQYITDDRLLDLLADQHDLDLRILTNDMPSNYPLSDRLGPNIVTLRKKPYSHDKMMIIDGRILLVGSMNFSDNALDNNREIGILSTDPKLVRQAGELFK